jgi:RNA-directed DNA polymerase
MRGSWSEYAEYLEANLLDLHARVHTAYRALPSRRKYIPKSDGRQRPLGIAAIEDKIVQAAVVTILTPIYESEFLGFQLRFPTEAQPASSAGCARVRDREATDQLGA